MTRTVVVDGSNLATEGRPLPSLRQLQEAVAAFREEHPDDQIIIVADATFGHRIESKEVEEFDLLVDHGQITCPPAGAVGRGDAFVLSIANKAKATVLSNDSFQEFHGTYTWLFDEDRLIGGKPVPHIGWVFVHRTPVRGPVSRKAVQQAKKGGRGSEAAPRAVKVSKEAFQPMPVPKVPPPSRARRADLAGQAPTPSGSSGREPAQQGGTPPPKGASINDLLPFLEFVELHPVGTRIPVVFDTYSSHGAYATVEGVRVYVPLRLMGDPAPRSAREVVKIGETRDVVIAGFNAARRGIDAAFADPIGAPSPSAPIESTGQPTKRSRGRGRGRGRSEQSGPGTREDRGDARPLEVAVFNFDSPEAGSTTPAPSSEPAKGSRPRRNPPPSAASPAALPAPTEPAPVAPLAPAAPVAGRASKASKARRAPKAPTSPAPPATRVEPPAPSAPPAPSPEAATKRAAKAPAKKALPAKRVAKTAGKKSAPTKAAATKASPPATAPAAKATAAKRGGAKAAAVKAPAAKASASKASVGKSPAKVAPAPAKAAVKKNAAPAKAATKKVGGPRRRPTP